LWQCLRVGLVVVWGPSMVTDSRYYTRDFREQKTNQNGRGLGSWGNKISNQTIWLCNQSRLGVVKRCLANPLQKVRQLASYTVPWRKPARRAPPPVLWREGYDPDAFARGSRRVIGALGIGGGATLYGDSPYCCRLCGAGGTPPPQALAILPTPPHTPPAPKPAWDRHPSPASHKESRCCVGLD